MSNSNTLPGAIAIAAKCEAIDMVTIEPQNIKPSHSYNPVIRTLRIGNWEKRLIKKSVDYLTEKINDFCRRSVKKPIFKPYIMYHPIKEGIWVYNMMCYDLVHN